MFSSKCDLCSIHFTSFYHNENSHTSVNPNAHAGRAWASYGLTDTEFQRSDSNMSHPIFCIDSKKRRRYTIQIQDSGDTGYTRIHCILYLVSCILYLASCIALGNTGYQNDREIRGSKNLKDSCFLYPPIQSKRL